MAGIVDFLKDEYAAAAKSFGILKELPKTLKNNPANAATAEAMFGLAGIVPGLGDVASAAESKYLYDKGDKFGAALAGLGALPLVPNVAGIFAGKGSKTWDAISASKAKAMEAAKIDPRTIWKETGTWKGPDGKWRQEIDDSGATAQFTHLPESGTDRIAGRAIEHPAAYEAYPGLARLSQLGLREPTPSGSFERIGDTGAIKLRGPTKESLKSTGVHELQHPIQQQEGFATGGSASAFARGPMFSQKARDLEWDLSTNLTGSGGAQVDELLGSVKYGDAEQIKNIARKHGFSTTDEALAFLSQQDIKRTPFGQYRRLAGEAEARAVQARMDMTPAQRRATFPEESYDVPIEDLIFKYDTEGLAASARNPAGLFGKSKTASLLPGMNKTAIKHRLGPLLDERGKVPHDAVPIAESSIGRIPQEYRDWRYADEFTSIEDEIARMTPSGNQ